MITRRDGSAATAASLLHLTPGDESLDRVAETYYSPGNAGGVGRPEFRRRLAIANPHLRTNGSILGADQLVRIDLRPDDPNAPMCRVDDVRHDLRRCTEQWRAMPPSVRHEVQHHGQVLHAIEKSAEYAPAFMTGVAEGIERILHKSMHTVEEVGAHYKANVVSPTASRAVHYASFTSSTSPSKPTRFSARPKPTKGWAPQSIKHWVSPEAWPERSSLFTRHHSSVASHSFYSPARWPWAAICLGKSSANR